MDRTHAYLTPSAAAEYLFVSPNTLANWRVLGQGPPFVKVGRAVRYRRADLDAFLESCRRASTSEGRASVG